ncbi:MAG: carbohydrate kinase family protein [Acidimicrobiales bacterium]
MSDRRPLVLGALGDLVEDIRVQLSGPVNVATDTEARIVRTRGGSAANVAVAAAAIEGRARFIGQVGNDPIGDAMAAMLADAGVEIAGRRGGRTGSIVVLVGADGERTMLTDRGSSHELVDPVGGWLDGIHTLHVPAYSLAVEPMAGTAADLITQAHERAMAVSIDLSSTALLADYGIDAFAALLARLAPAVVFANEDEAAVMVDHLDPMVDAGATVVVHGAREASARHGDETLTRAAEPLPEPADTTGAGDAFAAGYLCARAEGAELADALDRGHGAARRLLTAGMRAPR